MFALNGQYWPFTSGIQDVRSRETPRAPIYTVSGQVPGPRECLLQHHQGGSPPQQMKHTIHTRHLLTIEPLLVTENMERTLEERHAVAVNNSIDSKQNNPILDDRLPPISDEKESLNSICAG